MITLKEYAKNKHISYEAVRKQVKRYSAEELKDHIVVQGRTQFLDDFAVDFLNERRNENPIIIQEQSKDEEVDRLREENKNLLLKLVSVQDELNTVRRELAEEKDKLKQIQAEKIELLEQKIEPEPKMVQERKWYHFFRR